MVRKVVPQILHDSEAVDKCVKAETLVEAKAAYITATAVLLTRNSTRIDPDLPIFSLGMRVSYGSFLEYTQFLSQLVRTIMYILGDTEQRLPILELCCKIWVDKAEA